MYVNQKFHMQLRWLSWQLFWFKYLKFFRYPVLKIECTSVVIVWCSTYKIQHSMICLKNWSTRNEVQDNLIDCWIKLKSFWWNSILSHIFPPIAISIKNIGNMIPQLHFSKSSKCVINIWMILIFLIIILIKNVMILHEYNSFISFPFPPFSLFLSLSLPVFPFLLAET